MWEEAHIFGTGNLSLMLYWSGKAEVGIVCAYYNVLILLGLLFSGCACIFAARKGCWKCG